ncbi:MAG TPA: short chain dehydrogenase, partial [Gammaproteobacteria bacterium]|nr:short chain dehydrogenase [Gammaproteobacteria bacterium]
MKVIIVGAAGAVGKCAVDELSPRHEVIKAGRSRGDILVDLDDVDSIRAMYREAGKVDAVVSAVGHGHFGPLLGMT